MITRETLIDTIDLSVRAGNCLHRAGLHTIGKLVDFPEEKLMDIRNLGKKTLEEIVETRNRLMEELNSQKNGSTFDKILFLERLQKNVSYSEYDEENKRLIIGYLKEKHISVSQLQALSSKSYNMLLLSGIEELHEIICKTCDELMPLIRGMSDCAAEIERNCRHFLCTIKDDIIGFYENDTFDENQPNVRTIEDYIYSDTYKEKVLIYVKENDAELKFLVSSGKVRKLLEKHNFRMMSDIVFYDHIAFIEKTSTTLRNVSELMDVKKSYIDKHADSIIAYCNGDNLALLSEETIRRRIINVFDKTGFTGLHLPEIIDRAGLTDKTDEVIVKKVIGKLISEKVIEYVDYCCYRVYPSFYAFLDEIETECDEDDKRNFLCVRKKAYGMTYEEIGKEQGNITRERVRQIIEKTLKTIEKKRYTATGLEFFDEDYYSYFFTNYANTDNIKREECEQWLGISDKTYGYLDLFNSKGKIPLEIALSDPEIDTPLKLKIKNFLNRDKILVDGVFVKKKRTDIEMAVLRKFASDSSVTMDEFIGIYNGFLLIYGLHNDEKLYTPDALKLSRLGAISRSEYSLCGFNHTVRYYDVKSRNYYELLDTLEITKYRDVELSTMKFMNDYSEVMERYNINDRYELHNLLRKISDDPRYKEYFNGVKFEKMPIISFGNASRADQVVEIIKANSPVTFDDFYAKVMEEYGFEQGAVNWAWVSKYYHEKVFRIEHKQMTESEMNALNPLLTEDFYYIEEIEKILIDNFPTADKELINPYNLKVMGFSVRPKYAYRNYLSLDALFEHMLTEKEIIDLKPLRKKYGYVVSFSGMLTRLKSELEIVEFSRDSLIRLSKLEENGLTKADLKKFRKEVAEFVPENRVFTIYSIKKEGFKSELFEYGFDDYFYGDILAYCDDFSHVDAMSNTLLYKGDCSTLYIELISQIVKENDSIDILDLISDLKENYGCSNCEKWDITSRVRDTGMYYDPILERLYADESIYYNEIEGGLTDE